MNEIFARNAIDRLRFFLKSSRQKSEIQVLTPDASTREYFRVEWENKSAIACVYGESFKSSEHSYLDTTALFRGNDLPVAAIYDFDEKSGIIIQEDFGDTILREYFRRANHVERVDLLHQSIGLIARIQAATADAYRRNSVAARLKFDEEKLLWELNFFKTHYFETFRKTKLSDADDRSLNQEFIELARELAARAEVLCHRDFHAANLMLDREKRLRIIDHQDARIGTASYDLASLLLDRVVEPPAETWLAEKRRFFLGEREACGLRTIDAQEFDREFQMQAVQRCLKAVGTFSFQSTVRGKTYFIPFIEPTLQIVQRACRRLERFPSIQRIIEADLNP